MLRGFCLCLSTVAFAAGLSVPAQAAPETINSVTVNMTTGSGTTTLTV